MIKLEIINWQDFREMHESYVNGRWGDETLSYKQIKNTLISKMMYQLRTEWCIHNNDIGFQSNILSTWDDKVYCFDLVKIKCNQKGIRRLYVYYKGTFKG